MSRVLVTGAPGFLGTPLVQQICKGTEASRVRVLSIAPAPELTEMGVEVQVGSILTPANVARALDGVTHVYHLAGMVSRKPSDAYKMFQLHVHGTRILCEEALKLSVRRILMASTSGTIAISKRADEMPDEDSPTPIELIARWPYYSSKLYQEQTARRLCGDKIELVMVNPSLLLGPGDVRIGSTRDVVSFLSGDVKVVPSGGLNFVDSRDVAAIMPVAMEKGRPGERYLLGGHNMSFAEYFDRIERVSKDYHPRIKVPGRWAATGAKAQAAIFRALGRTPPIEPAAADQATHFWYFDGAKARRELGFAPREATETFFDTIQYVRENVLGVSAFSKTK
jgi:dihydroflavonol-4-reductase